MINRIFEGWAGRYHCVFAYFVPCYYVFCKPFFASVFGGVRNVGSKRKI